MKRTTKFLAGLFLFLGMSVSCLIPSMAEKANTLEPDNTVYQEVEVAELDNPRYATEGGSDEIADVNSVTIHYHNDDGKCGRDTTTIGTDGGRAFYVWVNGVDGEEYMPDAVMNDGQDMVITLDFSKPEFAGFKGRTYMLFIIKFRYASERDQNWGGQSADIELHYNEFPPDENGHVEVWTMPSGGSDIKIYATEEETKVDGIKSAEFVDFKTIKCTNTASQTQWRLYGFDQTYFKIDGKNRDKHKSKYLITTGTANSPIFDIKFKYNAHINMIYCIESLDLNSTTGLEKTCYVAFDKLYTNERFNEYYNYFGDDLGFTYTPQQTTFKLWAPTAANVDLLIYTSGAPVDMGGSNRFFSYTMYYTGQGIWELTMTGNLANRYYTYKVETTNGLLESIDPYATACGVNGVRGFIYDKNITDPQGWDDLPLVWDDQEGYDIETPQELSIYEVHMQDFTGDESWGGTEIPGTFKAFVEGGTKVPGTSVSTGYDHLNELGVKAVQILPFFDHDNTETDRETYNWGYNPLNFNCVEGLYSSDPTNPTTRIRELKQMVLKLSETESHTRVIMDVVYNHVSRPSASCFNKIMPKYYFRFHENGEYANGSGCSNEIRTEAPMMRKYIVDSVLMWATEYKIKGFRFDLMGLIDTETIRAVKDALYALDPDIYIYGEGWDGMGGYNGAEGTKGSYTDNVYADLYPTEASPGLVGAFNDAGRNAIRGGNDQYWGAELKHPGWGYMQQGPEHISADTRNNVANMLWGVHSGAGGNPLQHIAYASCHDNWTAFDQLYYTLGDTQVAPDLKTVFDASTAVHAYIMMCNSAAFMLGGEELFRTKEVPADIAEDILRSTYEDMYGHLTSHNSYNSPLIVNTFKWGNKISIERDGQTVDTSGYTEVFAEVIKLHTELPKYLPENGKAFPYKTTTAGNEIYGISWAGSEKGSSNPQTYNGCSGFQLDEYFVFLAGRQWGWVQFGDVPHSTKVFEFGPNEYDNVNGTVNVGNFDKNTGGAIVIYYRGKKM